MRTAFAIWAFLSSLGCFLRFALDLARLNSNYMGFTEMLQAGHWSPWMSAAFWGVSGTIFLGLGVFLLRQPQKPA